MHSGSSQCIENHTTGQIQIQVLTNCQAISTEIGTDSLKI